MKTGKSKIKVKLDSLSNKVVHILQFINRKLFSFCVLLYRKCEGTQDS